MEFFAGISRVLPSSARSRAFSRSNFSVAGLGPQAEQLLTQLPNTSYGNDCLYERLLKAGGKISGIGVGLG